LRGSRLPATTPDASRPGESAGPQGEPRPRLGIAAAEKRLSLDATLAELGIDDEPPLSKEEKTARFRDLIAARSGVYHTAAYAAADQDETRPARGSHPPGTFWFYNNWDFNAAETIYRRATGATVFEAFATKIAGPIGMEDLVVDLCAAGQTIFVACGTGGQALLVIPGLEMVIVHRGDTDHGRNVGGAQVWALAEQLAAARDGEAAARPTLRPVQALPLASQLPAPAAQTFVAIDGQAVQRLVGEYEIAGESGPPIRVFTDGPRLFMLFPGRGEAEMFALSPLEFTIKVLPGVTITFTEDAGRIAGVRVVVGRQTFEARRR
jgi:hypothetical protein